LTTVARFGQLCGNRRFIFEDSCTLPASRGALKYTIPIEVYHPVTRKYTRVVFCEFEVCNPCWGRHSHDKKMHESGVLWVWGMQSLLRSTFTWKKCILILNFDFDMLNPCWGQAFWSFLSCTFSLLWSTNQLRL
jgi:hypothetical protein